MIQVQLLVGVLAETVIYGVCGVAVSARLAVNQKVPVRLPARHPLDGKDATMTPRILQRPTLVLNRNWQPVNVATVARALVLLWNESARVVDPADYQLYTWADWSKLRPRNGEDSIQAVRFKLRVPEVVALNGYDRLPAAHVTFSRRNIFKRDHYTCQYCGCPAGQRGIDAGPRCPACAGRCVELGELRAGVHGLQQAEGRPDAGAGAACTCASKPVRPTWKPLYADHEVRIESWAKFLSEAYWNVTLRE